MSLRTLINPPTAPGQNSLKTTDRHAERNLRRVSGLLALMLLFAPALPRVSAEEGAAALADELHKLELQCNCPSMPGAPLLERLSKLEQTIFGVPQNGPVTARMQALRRIAETRKVLQKPQEQAGRTASPMVRPGSVEFEQALADPAGSPLQSSAVANRPNFQPDALPLVNAFPLSLLRKDDPDFSPAGDYYPEILKASKNRTVRFQNMPIPVYIQPYPDKDFVNCVVRAFESWESRSQGTVHFNQVTDPESARIRVLWKHLGMKSDKDGCLLGAHTILKYTNRGNGSLSLLSVGVVPVPVYIPRMGPKYVVPPQTVEVNLDLIMTKDYSIRYRCLQNIVAHELGHALGLLGHSPCKSDIMYPISDEHSHISQRDLNTLIKLYNTNKVDIPL